MYIHTHTQTTQLLYHHIKGIQVPVMYNLFYCKLVDDYVKQVSDIIKQVEELYNKTGD